MKFYFFHLMPYADLDLDYTKKYETAWVMLPNSYYDREKGRRLYERYLDELEFADTLGFDGIGVNEHHQTAYGMMPSPIVIASALARRTRNAKILILGSAIPLRENPLWLAEEHAMIDTISGGRLITGFVRGIGAEYHSTGVNPIHSHERFHEAHDLIVRAWTEPGPFRFHGKHYRFNYVNVWPKPYQQPHPPIWIPSQGSQETIEWASHPSRKYVYLQTFSAVAAVARFLKMYRDQAEKYGYEASGDQLGWAVPVYVAESDAAARKEARAHIEAFRNKFSRMPFEMLLPPGYLSMGSMKRVASAKAHMSREMTLEILDEEGMFICGSAETVRQRLADAQKTIGFNRLLPLLQFGTLPHDLTIKNATLFAREVMPQLRPLGEAKARAKEAAE